MIVGLGNPGHEYQETRHNLGHVVVGELARRFDARFRLRGPAHVAEATWQGGPLHLAKLVSFMNVSGPPLARLLRLLDATPTSSSWCTTTWICLSGRSGPGCVVAMADITAWSRS